MLCCNTFDISLYLKYKENPIYCNNPIYQSIVKIKVKCDTIQSVSIYINVKKKKTSKRGSAKESTVTLYGYTGKNQLCPYAGKITSPDPKLTKKPEKE